mgnify:FL=1
MIPIVVRIPERLRHEVRLDSIKNLMYDKYAPERTPKYDNSKWRTKYQILKKFIFYPDEIIIYSDSIHTKGIATQRKKTTDDMEIA